jgi:hypothetical protein
LDNLNANDVINKLLNGQETTLSEDERATLIDYISGMANMSDEVDITFYTTDEGKTITGVTITVIWGDETAGGFLQ